MAKEKKRGFPHFLIVFLIFAAGIGVSVYQRSDLGVGIGSAIMVGYLAILSVIRSIKNRGNDDSRTTEYVEGNQYDEEWYEESRKRDADRIQGVLDSEMRDNIRKIANHLDK